MFSIEPIFNGIRFNGHFWRAFLTDFLFDGNCFLSNLAFDGIRFWRWFFVGNYFLSNLVFDGFRFWRAFSNGHILREFFDGDFFTGIFDRHFLTGIFWRAYFDGIFWRTFFAGFFWRELFSIEQSWGDSFLTGNRFRNSWNVQALVYILIEMFFSLFTFSMKCLAVCLLLFKCSAICLHF